MPPGIKDPSLALKALKNILICHAKAYDIIHKAHPEAMVSVAHNMAALAPWHRWNPLDRALAKMAKYFYNHSLTDAFLTGHLKVKFPLRKEVLIEVPIKDKLDFFGVNYYTRVHIRFNPFKQMLIELRHLDIDGYGLSDLGWEIHPYGLEKVLRYASRLNVPLIITENGIATRNAETKIDFMRKHVDAVERSIKKGIDVRDIFTGPLSIITNGYRVSTPASDSTGSISKLSNAKPPTPPPITPISSEAGLSSEGKTYRCPRHIFSPNIT